MAAKKSMAVENNVRGYTPATEQLFCSWCQSDANIEWLYDSLCPICRS